MPNKDKILNPQNFKICARLLNFPPPLFFAQNFWYLCTNPCHSLNKHIPPTTNILTLFSLFYRCWTVLCDQYRYKVVTSLHNLAAVSTLTDHANNLYIYLPCGSYVIVWCQKQQYQNKKGEPN